MRDGKRHLIQTAAFFAQNPFVGNFFKGKIYQGAGKQVCVPGLNCYSCPAAAGACPIGSLQSALGGRTPGFPYYVVGLLLLFGTLFGRLICGFLCPFGFLQDLLYKIRSRKPKLPDRVDRPLRYGKYVTLAAVILLPLLLRDPFGLGTPAFCKYLCPVGTLEGGVPLVLGNAGLRGAVGWLFSWKLTVLLAVLAASVLLYRPFCKYLCPLGGLYGLMNRFSLYRLSVDETKCTHCGACARACKMGVNVPENPNSAECIRCGVCRDSCSAHAICGEIRARRDAGTERPKGRGASRL